MPAFATTAKCVVGPGKPRLATFTPPVSSAWYAKLPEAAVAKQQLAFGLAWFHTTRCPRRASVVLDIMLRGRGGQEGKQFRLLQVGQLRAVRTWEELDFVLEQNPCGDRRAHWRPVSPTGLTAKKCSTPCSSALPGWPPGAFGVLTPGPNSRGTSEGFHHLQLIAYERWQ